MESGAGVDVVLLRRAHALRNTGLAIAAAGAIIGFSVTGDSRILWVVGLLFTGGLLALLGIEGTPRRVAARLDADGLRVGDRLVAPRRSFRAAWIERADGRTCVHVHRIPALRLEARDDEDGRRLLCLLGLDRSQTVLRLPSSVAAIWGTLCLQIALQGLFESCDHVGWTSGGIALKSLLVLVLVLLTFFSVHGETIIGADGVLFSRPLRRRFVPFSEIESVCYKAPGKLVVRMRGGGAFKCSMSAPVAQAALEAIERSLGSIAGASEAVRRRLRRSTSDQDAAAWLARVRELASPTSYRATGLTASALWQVIDDPGASGSERAAAAVALDVNATRDERQRLHDVAARIASPRVRIAIKRAAARRPPSLDSAPEGLPEARVRWGDDDDDPLTDALARIMDQRSNA